MIDLNNRLSKELLRVLDIQSRRGAAVVERGGLENR